MQINEVYFYLFHRKHIFIRSWPIDPFLTVFTRSHPFYAAKIDKNGEPM